MIRGYIRMKRYYKNTGIEQRCHFPVRRFFSRKRERDVSIFPSGKEKFEVFSEEEEEEETNEIISDKLQSRCVLNYSNREFQRAR